MKKLLSVLAVLGMFVVTTNLWAEEEPVNPEPQEIVVNQEIQEVQEIQEAPAEPVVEEVSVEPAPEEIPGDEPTLEEVLDDIAYADLPVEQNIQEATVNPENETVSASGDKVLVAYFSATGNTKSVAEKLANTIDADLFEITPITPYSAEDLDWQNENSRVSYELKDEDFFPAIASRKEDMDQYKTVFVGFPIWNGREPSIIKMFMFSYNLSGKKVIPFATSGSSDIGNIYEDLSRFSPNATIVPGKRFPVDVSDEELKTWANEQMQ